MKNHRVQRFLTNEYIQQFLIKNIVNINFTNKQYQFLLLQNYLNIMYIYTKLLKETNK